MSTYACCHLCFHGASTKMDSTATRQPLPHRLRLIGLCDRDRETTATCANVKQGESECKNPIIRLSNTSRIFFNSVAKCQSYTFKRFIYGKDRQCMITKPDIYNRILMYLVSALNFLLKCMLLSFILKNC